MSLWEWIFERRNPGPIGDMNVKKSEFADEDMPRWKQVVCFCIGVVSWAVTIYLLVLSLEKNVLVDVLIFLVVYLIISWVLHPKPDQSNMGWAGGIIDNPFRWSDDMNRMLLFFLVILSPGKLMLFSIHILRYWLRKK